MPCGCCGLDGHDRHSCPSLLSGHRSPSPTGGAASSTRRSPRSTPRRKAARNVTREVLGADGVLDLSLLAVAPPVFGRLPSPPPFPMPEDQDLAVPRASPSIDVTISQSIAQRVPDTQDSAFSFGADDGWSPLFAPDDESALEEAWGATSHSTFLVLLEFASASSSGVEASQVSTDNGAVASPSAPGPELGEIINALTSLRASDRSSVMIASTAPRADVAMTDETPLCDPFATGACHCPWCPGPAYNTDTAFVRHLTCMHEGVAIDDTMHQLLLALGRGACPKPGCGCLRRAGSRHCHRCGETHSLRRIVLGDIIPGGRGVPLRTEAVAAPVHVSNSNQGSSSSVDTILPDNFLKEYVAFHHTLWCTFPPHPASRSPLA